MHLRHLRSADARRVPWKNGRGVTEELLIWPPGASFERGDFDWRIARAGVAEDGPFSAFPGFERVLVVVAGEGLRLRHGGAAPVRVPRLQPHRFSGDDATSAELIGGPVTDLNVLLRRSCVVAEVSVLQVGKLQLPASEEEHRFFHVIDGMLCATAEGKQLATVASSESVWIRGGAPAIELQARNGEATLVLLRLSPPAPALR